MLCHSLVRSYHYSSIKKYFMTDYSEVSHSGLYDAMIQAMEEGMAAGFSGSKMIDGKTPGEWVTNYIQEMYDEDFGKEGKTTATHYRKIGGNNIQLGYLQDDCCFVLISIVPATALQQFSHLKQWKGKNIMVIQ